MPDFGWPIGLFLCSLMAILKEVGKNLPFVKPFKCPPECWLPICPFGVSTALGRLGKHLRGLPEQLCSVVLLSVL